MAIVPFPKPTATVTRAAALALIRLELGLPDNDEGNAVALRLGEAASALICRYDNSDDDESTPQAILDEAALRVAAWLLDPSTKVNIRSVDTGAVKLDYLSKRNALRSSGAMDLLSAWRMHGAGVVGE